MKQKKNKDAYSGVEALGIGGRSSACSAFPVEAAAVSLLGTILFLIGTVTNGALSF